MPQFSDATTPLRFVRTSEDVRTNLRTFACHAADNLKLVRSLVHRATYWVYDPDAEVFGPCKFLGYDGMTFGRYQAARDGEMGGSVFDGHPAQKAVAEALRANFSADEALSEKLVDWAEDLVSPGFLAGVNQAKWQFIRLPRPLHSTKTAPPVVDKRG